MENEIVELVARVFKTDAASLNAGSGPRTLSAWDSAGHMRLIVELEKVFGIEIPDEKISAFVTVGAIAEYIQSVKGA